MMSTSRTMVPRSASHISPISLRGQQHANAVPCVQKAGHQILSMHPMHRHLPAPCSRCQMRMRAAGQGLHPASCSARVGGESCVLHAAVASCTLAVQVWTLPLGAGHKVHAAIMRGATSCGAPAHAPQSSAAQVGPQLAAHVRMAGSTRLLGPCKHPSIHACMHACGARNSRDQRVPMVGDHGPRVRRQELKVGLQQPQHRISDFAAGWFEGGWAQWAHAPKNIATDSARCSAAGLGDAM